MTDDNVVEFPGETLLDIPPQSILEGAKEESLEQVLVVGVTKDGSSYFASSTADLYQVLWLLENAKMDVLETARE